ncbi:YceI family protein [Adhaeribacter soli]|uniref:YceI family protein n=1 Tax=Adhaeribacter soli TaxID=2607655 RepID=A0A5N1ITE5_9BACT|nr:YceI family protein [Adhaeribacter soli]KAA9331179.1 YceI family protein [Adhaeribacter soli]
MPAFLKTLTTVLLLQLALPMQAQIYKAGNGRVNFFAKGPLSNLAGESDKLTGSLNNRTRQVAFSVPVKSFAFRQSLMKSQFNEQYMESDKYPKASFTGVILGNADFSKPGTYPVTARGKLTIHGETRERTIPGTLVSDGKTIRLTANFPVSLPDHNIKVPRLAVETVTSEVAVHLNITLKPVPAANPAPVAKP